MDFDRNPDRERLRRLVTGQMDTELVTKQSVRDLIRDQVSASVKLDDDARAEVQRVLNLLIRQVYNLEAKS